MKAAGFLLVASGLVAGALRAEEVRVEASVDAERVGIEDELTLVVSIHGDTRGRASSPELPRLDGFRIAGRSQSTRVQWVNGVQSSTRSFLYRLVPRAQGRHRIGPVKIDYEGKEYRTEPVEVEVVPGSVRAGSGTASSGRDDPLDRLPPVRRSDRDGKDPEIFVSAELSRSSAYVGQPVILTYRLYRQAPILGLELDQQPAFTGFWVEPVPASRQPEWEEVQVDGKTFEAIDVKKMVLIPTRAGSLEIEPAVFSMAVRSSHPLDSLFLRASEPIRRSTRPVTLPVRPLPEEGRPESFSGAVGRFELSADLDRRQATVGEPLTLSITLEGEGNFTTIDAPRLPPVPGLRGYDPKLDESAGAEGLRGRRTWEYVLVPTSAGRFSVGPFSYTYFDPEEERYVALEAGALALEVTGPGATGPRPMNASGGDDAPRDIRYLKPLPDGFGMPPTPFHLSHWFYLTLALPVLANLAALAYVRRKRRGAAEQEEWRRRLAQKMARSRLKRAAELARKGSRELYEETAAALYRYVADKMGVAPAGLSLRGMESMLAERAVPGEVRSAYLRAVEDCECARFTPGERSPEEMQALLERAERAIVSLDRHLS